MKKQAGNNNMKIIGVYKITNTITGDFYIGSSKDVKRRWSEHKKPSVWKKCPNKQLYKDMQKYSVDKFEFDILCEVESERLKETEQKFIEMLKPTYNSNNANGWDIERYKEYQIEYYQQNCKKRKEYQIEYYKQNCKKRKEYQNKYDSQLCRYNDETITLSALRMRFKKLGIEHPAVEAKKYLLKQKKRAHALVFAIVKDL